jgi:hypothetical protein
MERFETHDGGTLARTAPATPEIIAPLSERILARLGRPRALWVVAWGSLAFVTYELSFRIYHVPTYPGLSFSLASAYLNILVLWGIGKVAHGLYAGQPLIEDLLGKRNEGPATHPFRLVGSTAGPLLLSIPAAVVWAVELSRYPSAVGAVSLPLVYIGWLPAFCALWVCLALFLGLNHLGRQPLQLKPFHQERGLGLAPLGGLAFAALLLIVGALMPFLLVTVKDPRSTTIILVYLSAAVAAFFVCQYHLHLQLMAAKRQYLAHVRSLHAEAFAPFEFERSLGALVRQANHIGAAKALEHEVSGIQEWPVGERIIARVVAIVMSVITTIVARLILKL